MFPLLLFFLHYIYYSKKAYLGNKHHIAGKCGGECRTKQQHQIAHRAVVEIDQHWREASQTQPKGVAKHVLKGVK